MSEKLLIGNAGIKAFDFWSTRDGYTERWTDNEIPNAGESARHSRKNSVPGDKIRLAGCIR